MNAVTQPTPETMHRGAKMFMDRGEAADYGAALAILGRFRLAILVGGDASGSVGIQVALLTAVNVARRSFLGGVFVAGCTDVPCITPLGGDGKLRDAVASLGGILSDEVPSGIPTLLIGGSESTVDPPTALRVTWGGWSGGVVRPGGKRLAEDSSCSLAAILAACIGVAELFQVYTGDVPQAGRRNVGLSLWKPSADWTVDDALGPTLRWLPSNLWLIGLGNLGQAYLWCLGALPYEQPGKVQLVLQDFDRLEPSNDSTSVLSRLRDIGIRKTRMTAAWAERAGFGCRLLESRFGAWTRRSDEAEDPAVALFGVDNAYARSLLEDAGFSLVVEAGLGAGPAGYGDLTVHTFPSTRTARSIWGTAPGRSEVHPRLDLPAYKAAAAAGLDPCGLLTLAAKTVGVPFVGLTAAAFVVAELLRRIHGGEPVDIMSIPMSSPHDREVVPLATHIPYFGEFTSARGAPKLTQGW